jgi:hypothetical protein
MSQQQPQLQPRFFSANKIRALICAIVCFGQRSSLIDELDMRMQHDRKYHRDCGRNLLRSHAIAQMGLEKAHSRKRRNDVLHDCGVPRLRCPPGGPSTHSIARQHPLSSCTERRWSMKRLPATADGGRDCGQIPGTCNAAVP